MIDKREKCLVLGVNGQDGSYTAEHLLSRGYEVIGIGRQTESNWVNSSSQFTYHSMDLRDTGEFSKALLKFKPARIFNMAALHGSAGFSYESNWEDAHLINTMVTHASLEYLRRDMPGGSMVYISSSKAFGAPPPQETSENSPLQSSCIYSITKNSATELIHYYRLRHKVDSSVIWTFNHESPRRSSTFFIPQIVKILANCILTPSYVGTIGTLHFWCDWGDADEYMDIVVDISESSPDQDFILATGKTLWAKDFVHDLFSRYQLDAARHITESMAPPVNPLPYWFANIGKLETGIGRIPQRTIHNVCDDILRLQFPNAWQLVGRK